MALSTYLTFDGNCREAFEFYRSVFGGEYQVFTTFGEGPDDMGVGEDEKDRVMHVSLPVGDSVLMGSDSSPQFGPPHQLGNNFSISVAAESRSTRTCSTPGCRRVAWRRCRWKRRSGAPTSGCAPTVSASTGWCRTNWNRPNRSRKDVELREATSS